MTSTLKFGWLVAGFMLLLPEVGFAQQSGAVSGKVTDAATGKGLPGVNVVIVGRATGAATDLDGAYRIEGLAPGVYDVQASFIGFLSQTVEEVPVAAGQDTALDFRLDEDIAGLDEVVVVGYGTQRRRDLTGAVTSVNAEAIQSAPLVSLEQALQGRTPGVQVRQNSGELGGNFSVFVRGVSSTGASQPLYVVDGVPLAAGALETLNPDDFESIEVLKDASATAIYGARASNGVVLITTRQGGEGRTRIRFSSDIGVQRAAKTPDMLTGPEMKEIFVTAHNNSKLPVPLEFQAPGYPTGLPDNDWVDLMLRPALMQEYSLSVEGGTAQTLFAISGAYTNREGILINTDLQRISLRANLDHQPFKRLKIGARLNGSRQWQNGANTNQEFGSPWRTAMYAKPWIPNRDENGNFAPMPPRSGITFGLLDNPVAMQEREMNQSSQNRFLGSVFAEILVLPELNFRSSFGTDLTFFDDYLFVPVWPQGGIYARTSDLLVNSGTSNQTNWVTDQTLTYQNQFGDHDLTALAGFTAQQFQFENVRAIAFGQTNNNLRTIANQPSIQSVGGSENQWGLVSYFGRVQYDFASRYIITATVRRDGSSRFGPGNRYGTFPSASVGWRISEEPFLRSIAWLDDLKLRASYGLTGNQNIGDFQYLARAGVGKYAFGNTVVETAFPNSFANDALQWETVKQSDLGFDALLLGGRISLTADVYDKTSEDLLVSIPLPPSNGVTNLQTLNLGSVKNRGFEMAAMTTPVRTRDFQWDLDVNASYNENEVADLGTDAQGEALVVYGRQVSNPFRVPVNMTKIGLPIGSIIGYEFDGIYQLGEEAAAAVYGREPGDTRYRDVNGDGRLDQNDWVVLGQPQPKWYGGINNRLRYKNWTMSVLANFQTGHTIMNLERAFLYLVSGNLNAPREWLNHWSPENPSNEIPRPKRSGSEPNALASSYFAEDASFLRINQISLSYALPQRWIAPALLSRAEITLSALNPFVFTGYSGLDPELNSFTSPLNAGQDMSPFPISRTFFMRVNLMF